MKLNLILSLFLGNINLDLSVLVHVLKRILDNS